jgi:membrane protein DedA with SNARE-associated domain
MERRFGQRRSHQVEQALENWGFGAVFVSTVVPPPFPTAVFLLAAGAFTYDLRRFLAAVFSGRVIRYGLLAAVAARYGRTIVHYMRHPGEHIWISLLVTAIVVLVVSATLLTFSKGPSVYEPQGQKRPSPRLGWRT